ncbi:MAG: cation:proton antiporter, partial [Gemmatimonadetes bacterium]|nr:cation:proton antiporter [Gemmatimonadota bacterium]
MNNTAVVAAVLSVMALLFLTTVLSVVTRKVRLPFSITLVLVGIGLAELIRLDPSLAPLARLQLSPALLTYIFLPTLIFETAFAVDSRLLSKNLLPVLVLAIPGVALSAVAAALGFQWALGLPIVVALLLGALVTSTDSTAVTAIFRDLGAPKRLHILAQGENLFNDAASVLLFQLLLAALGLAGAAVLYRADGLLTSATISFLLTFAGGLLVGAASGYVIGKLIEIIEDDELVEILLTTV